MKTRLHHKVSPASIYHDPALDAPWPLKECLVRIVLYALIILGIFSWGVIGVLLGIVGREAVLEILLPLIFLAVLTFVVGGIVLTVDPLNFDLSEFKAVLAWTSPPAVIFYRLPRMVGRFVWSICRLGGKTVRIVFFFANPFKPLGPFYWRRMALAVIIGLSLVCWNIIPLIVYHWHPFPRNGWDLSVVCEVLAILPLAFIANRLLDLCQTAAFDDYFALRVLEKIFSWTNPVILAYGLGVRPVIWFCGRKFFGRHWDPDWLP